MSIYSYTTPGDYTYTAPSSITFIKIECWGGGGGGTSGNRGIGGTGGSYSNKIYKIVPGNNYYIHVGNKGLGGLWGGPSYSYGEASNFKDDSTIICQAKAYSGSPGLYINVGDISYDGGSPGNLVGGVNLFGSGGGGGAGSNGAGGKGGMASLSGGGVGGLGTTIGGGDGGAGGGNGGGLPGSNFGGAGGGGGINGDGGDGAVGRVDVTELYNYSVNIISYNE
jgi:hypothetical protein